MRLGSKRHEINVMLSHVQEGSLSTRGGKTRVPFGSLSILSTYPSETRGPAEREAFGRPTG